MVAAEDRSRSGLSRRDALRLLAASSTTVAAGSMIISQPAYADSGSAPCRYRFSQDPRVTVRVINQSGGRRDFLSISVDNVIGGTCPCDEAARPTVEYAYWIIIRDLGSGGIGWTNSTAVSVGSPSTLWDNQGGSVTIAVGVRVTCPAAVGNAVRCRFGSARFDVDGPNSNTTERFTLGSENGGNNPPDGIPACGQGGTAPLQRSAPLLRNGGATGGLSITPGAGSPPQYDPSAGDVSTDLGVPETDSTTTTTAKPDATPETTIESTTTSTTSPTTTTPDTSSTTSTTSTTTSLPD